MDIFKLFAKLIRIYTPFICAITALIHGVLYLFKINSVLRIILGDLTGHSILLILYIIATSHRMCKWYKITNYLLLLIHIINIGYVYNFITYDNLLYAIIILSILAILSFLIYQTSVGITKILC